MLGLSLLAVIAGFGRAVGKFRQRTVRSALKWIVIGSGVAAVGVAYGVWQAVQDPVRIDALVGQPVIVEGSVQSAKDVAGGRMYELFIDRVQRTGQVTRTQVKVDWTAWAPTGELAHLSAGEDVTASGVLVFPPVTTNKGVPLRKELAQGGIFYEFEGHLETSAMPPNTLVTRVRGRLAKSVASLPYGTAEQQVLLSSVVFGGENVAASEKQAFLKAGLLHVLAASGANLMLVEQAFVRIFRPIWNKLRLPAVIWALLLVAFNWGFALLCGTAPSLTRAAILASYRHTAQMLSRRVRTLDGLAATAVVQAVIWPSQVTSASFLLSFVATGALALVLEHSFIKASRRLGTGRLKRMVRVLTVRSLTTVATSVAIELALFPLTLTLFQQITPYAMLTNVIAEPLLTLLLPLAALYIGVAALLSVAAPLVACAAPLASVTYGMLSAVSWLANTVAAWPGALISTPSLSNSDFVATGLYVLAGLVLLTASERRKRRLQTSGQTHIRPLSREHARKL
ncbi:ComEC/Rec2 family competence protein [Alicyclobacillus sp. ALC3]|uniref:ComEC/Rec2 family competence protein n=1 Tax=Alicyclobacillus sp. ALC3 TaxID=2796143 RepID=UPI002379742D|nr:ComEC/Rec2 family competence protein [Alicyclobacillus sp. ALC3]